MRPAWKTTFHSTALVFVGVWTILILCGQSRFFRDPGTFWHVSLGEYWLDHGQLLQHDTFTFTRQGERWLPLQWIGEAVMAAGYRIGGWDLLLLGTVTLLASLLAWLAHRLTCRGVHWLPMILLLTFCIGASSHHFHVRPHLMSVVCLPLVYALLIDVESRRSSPSRLLMLVPLFCLWTNVHGGVLGGWITVAAWAGSVLAARIVCRLRPDGRRLPEFREPDDGVNERVAPVLRVWHLLLLPVVLGGTFLLNPYGGEMPLRWIEIMSMPLPKLIDEHRPTTLFSPEGAACAVLAVAYLGVLADAWRQKRRWAWLLPLIWLLLGIGRVRHVPLFAVVSLVAIADMIPWTRLSKRLARTDLFLPDRVNRRFATVDKNWVCLLPIVLVVTTLGFQFGQVRIPVIGDRWAGPARDRWPVELVRLLNDQATQTNGRVFNDLHFGGYLALHAPRLKTLVDDRCELFGAEFLIDYRQTQLDPQSFEPWHRRYRFELALPRRGSPLDKYLSENDDWRQLGQSACATLYRRRKG